MSADHDPSTAGGAPRPAEPDDTWPYERAQMLLTTTDVDLFAGILRPVVGLIATVRLVGHDHPLDVHLDDVLAGERGAPPRLSFRRVNAALAPVGHPEQVGVDTIAHLHLW